MSETPSGIPKDKIYHYGVLNRLLGLVFGKESAGGATPRIGELRKLAQSTPPEQLDQFLEMAAISQRKEYQRQGLIDPDEPTQDSPNL